MEVFIYKSPILWGLGTHLFTDKLGGTQYEWYDAETAEDYVFELKDFSFSVICKPERKIVAVNRGVEVEVGTGQAKIYTRFDITTKLLQN